MKRILNANCIKVIAILAMTLDHIAWMLFPGYPTDMLPLALHIVGRVTCPIMCYFIAEGFHYTKNINKYTFRLFFFAVISHFAYQYFSGSYTGPQSFIPFHNGQLLNQTSVMWSLAWGLVMLRVDSSEKIRSKLAKTILTLLICLVALPSDWSCIASLCILAFGTNRGNLKAQMFWMVFYVALYSIVYCLTMDIVYGILQLAVVLVIPILMLYNGKLGQNPKVNKFMKWLFYIYYPLHLIIFGFLQHSIK